MPGGMAEKQTNKKEKVNADEKNELTKKYKQISRNVSGNCRMPSSSIFAGEGHTLAFRMADNR